MQCNEFVNFKLMVIAVFLTPSSQNPIDIPKGRSSNGNVKFYNNEILLGKDNYIRFGPVDKDSRAVSIHVASKNAQIPPNGTECYALGLIPSNVTEGESDFMLEKHPISINTVEECAEFYGTKNYGCVFCGSTQTKLQTDYAKLVVCDQWYEANNSNEEISASEHTKLTLMCVWYPNKPWCNPDMQCNITPDLPRCQVPPNVGPASAHRKSRSIKQWVLAGNLVEGVNVSKKMGENNPFLFKTSNSCNLIN